MVATLRSFFVAKKQQRLCEDGALESLPSQRSTPVLSGLALGENQRKPGQPQPAGWAPK
jgi:hypothetical protein